MQYKVIAFQRISREYVLISREETLISAIDMYNYTIRQADSSKVSDVRIVDEYRNVIQHCEIYQETPRRGRWSS